MASGGRSQSPSGSATSADVKQFPLDQTHNWTIACSKCLVQVSQAERGLLEKITTEHECEQDLLAVRKNGEKYFQWVRIRNGNRKKIREYKLCPNYMDGKQCPLSEETCTFAHNEVERVLWSMDMEGTFSIIDFIHVKRNRGKRALKRLKKHGGLMVFLCKACYFSSPRRISDGQNGDCQAAGHAWEENKMMCHVHNGAITVIWERFLKRRSVYLSMCQKKDQCPSKFVGGCTFAHSEVEMDVWMVEKLMALTRDEIKLEMNQNSNDQVEAERVKRPSASASRTGSTVDLAQTGKTAELCPYKVIYVCRTCHGNGRNVEKGKSKTCAAQSHDWEQNKMAVCASSGEEIRVWPAGFKGKFVLCLFRNNDCCSRYRKGKCRHPHSDTELNIWTWQRKNEVRSLDKLVELSSKSDLPSVASASTGSTSTSTPPREPKGFFRDSSLYYCKICSTRRNSQNQIDDHFSSPAHEFNVTSDEAQQWNYREPPWSICGKFELCKSHVQNESYSTALCQGAHSQEELAEWKLRYKWRQRSIPLAWTEGFVPYINELLDKHRHADDSLDVMREMIDVAKIDKWHPDPEYTDDKTEKFKWKFKIVAEGARKLERVTLLYNKARFLFELQNVDDNPMGQTCQGEKFRARRRSFRYNVFVKFHGGMFGSFVQRVVFDFGQLPVVYRDLAVHIGTRDHIEENKLLTEKVDSERLGSTNTEVIELQKIMSNTDEEDMMAAYRGPDTSEEVGLVEGLTASLNAKNYVHQMHRFLYLEELARNRIISSFNLRTAVELKNSITEESGMFIFARPGELFARVQLNNELTYDTDAGALVLDSAPTVLVARDGSEESTVYEAAFVDRETYSYEGRGKDFIVLVLKEACCKGLGFVADTEVQLMLQFRMDRLPFARMHYALDQLQDTEVLFPDFGKIAQGLLVKHVGEIRSGLNDSQQRMLRYIAGEVRGYCPPMIMYGPFGTGKTETLVHAAMILARDLSGKRVLICTQSNSAADLYVTRLQKHNPGIRMCRLLALRTPLNRVDETVRQYCFLSKDGTEVVTPTRDGILVCQVVISTLVNSLLLTRLQLRGHFTHIFIDEAGQALESESVIPLLLADRTTCCVLTGDHIQMSPKVYSTEAQRFKFHHSILERLFYHYKAQLTTIPPTDFPLMSFLTVNYRSSPAIVHFIATVFYNGTEIKTVEQPLVRNVPPLLFSAVEGREVQDEDGTSYYNMDEANQVADAVSGLWEHWPEEWGERNAKDVAVVTPYREQVLKMRYALRKKSRDLRNITVERVQNVQGKEVRVLFISTVRTRFVCDDHQANPGTISDLGFLTDKKLLNTAMTRARSTVAVFGDPVALCSIGECARVWEVYIEHCQWQRGLYPTSMDLNDVRMAVQQFQREPKYMSLLSHLGKSDQMEKQDAQIDEDLDFTSCEMEPDEILKQLANQIREEKAAGSESTHPVDAVDASSIVIKLTPDEAVLYCSETTEDRPTGAVLYNRNSSTAADGATTSDDVTVLYSRNSTTAERTSTTAGCTSREFHSAKDADEVTSSADVKSFEELLETKPDVYKRCIVHIKSSRNMYAEIIDDRDNEASCRINLSSRLRCGQALDQDTVVVQILKPFDDDPDEAGSVSLQGRVLGILKREKDPKYRIFVCSVDPFRTSMMVPIDQGMPKIYSLSQENHRHKKGKVIVYTFKQGHVKFKKYEDIDQLNPRSKLFAVRYLKWKPGRDCPLGIVVDVLPQGNTVARGLDILHIENKATEKNSGEAMKQVSKQFPKGYNIPHKLLNQKGRLDYSSKLVLAIDPPGTEDVDDAISFEKGNKPDTFLIGVHIADVTAFVDKDSPLDKDASTRCTSLYPLGADIVHMLPKRLSTDIVSLRDKQNRLALSIFMIVDKEGTVREVQSRRCIVNSTQLTYEEVEKYLSADCGHLSQTCQMVRLKILCLYQIVQMWRRKRMGNASLRLASDDDAKDSPKAHCLVKEVMLMASHQVARHMMGKFAECTPLRRHLAPNQRTLAEWKKKYALDAINSLSLRYPFVSPRDICNCKDVCACVQDPPGEPLNIRDKAFIIRKDVWNQIHQCTETDSNSLAGLILEPDNHPQLTVAERQLRRIQSSAEYCNSGDTTEEERWLYKENLNPYTHFTSPIRRFFDVVVQRIMVAGMDGLPCPYSEDEINDICQNMTSASRRTRRYEQMVRSLHLAASLEMRPMIAHPVVDEVDDRSIHLVFPNQEGLSSQCVKPRIKLSNMNLAEILKYDEVNSRLTVQWQQRIYELGKDLEPTGPAKRRGPGPKVVELNPDKFVHHIPCEKWQSILLAVVAEDHDRLLSALQEAKPTEAPQRSSRDARSVYVEEVTSEVQNGERLTRHFCQFKLDIKPGQVMEMQLGKSMARGLMQPRIHLVNLTPKFSLCLEHQMDMLECFTKSVAKPASRKWYIDIEDYQRAWLPVMALESATSALDSGDNFQIQNVPIEWKEALSARKKTYCGMLELPVGFCEERHIRISASNALSVGDTEVSYSYLCIKYNGITPAVNQSQDTCPVRRPYMPFTWVGHCLMTEAQIIKKEVGESVRVFFKLHQNTVKFPNQLLAHKGGREKLCTVEFIPKALPNRRMETAIRRTVRVGTLANRIALKREPARFKYAEHDVVKRVCEMMEVSGLNPPNDGQAQAIKKALKQPFTLIQGPPGTGKTAVGAHIAFLFTLINRQLGDTSSDRVNKMKAKVMYCGPSNKSVDVVASYLKKIKTEPKPTVVRMYSELLERKDFPIPMEPIPLKRRKTDHESSLTEEHKEIALHHIIRTCETDSTSRLLEFDRRFKAEPDKVTLDEIKAYKKLVCAMEVEALGRAEIILCTCTASGNPKIRKLVDPEEGLPEHCINQVIVDECGMCQEPESMIPITAARPSQVVLIGDHKQLQPIILNDMARRLGLGTSLFERYSQKADMLTVQYRMHEAIAAFPSEKFYDGRLQVGHVERQTGRAPLKVWPGPSGRLEPIAFCHVVGREETQTVASAEGNVKSRKNVAEAKFAVDIAQKLVHLGVQPQNVAVLSQYRAQCGEIEKRLMQRKIRGKKDVKVGTVVSSQGSEWEYVILSMVASLPRSEIDSNPPLSWVRKTLGFITNQNQINVAITRAKKGLIIIGNRYLLQCDEMWKELLQHYQAKGKIVEVRDFKLLQSG